MSLHEKRRGDTGGSEGSTKQGTMYCRAYTVKKMGRRIYVEVGIDHNAADIIIYQATVKRSLLLVDIPEVGLRCMSGFHAMSELYPMEIDVIYSQAGWHEQTTSIVQWRSQGQADLRHSFHRPRKYVEELGIRYWGTGSRLLTMHHMRVRLVIVSMAAL